MLAEELRTNFTAVYGGSGEGIRTFFAPGRINLIGGHTDYNGGHVFPCALTFGIYGAARIREDRLIRFFSEDRRTSGISTASEKSGNASRWATARYAEVLSMKEAKSFSALTMTAISAFGRTTGIWKG